MGIPGMHPLEWAAIVRRLIKPRASTKELLNTLKDRLKKIWNVKSLTGIGVLLGIPFDGKTLSDEMSLLSRPSLVTQRLVILDAVNQLFGPNFIGDVVHDLPFFRSYGSTVLPESYSSDDSVFDEIDLIAIGEGLPLGIVEMIKSGKLVQRGELRDNWLKIRVKVFLKNLPKSLWLELNRNNYYIRIDDKSPSISIRNTHPAHLSERREYCRQQLRSLMDLEPTLSRTSARIRICAGVAWLRRHDRKWYEKTLPSRRKGASFRERRDYCRQKLLTLLNKEPQISRTAAEKKIQCVMAWIRKHDQKWYCKTLPSRREYASRKGRRKDCRRQLLELISSEPNTTRTSAYKKIKAVMEWLRKYDCDWYDRKLPPSRQRMQRT
jgi:hypothetical protein